MATTPKTLSRAQKMVTKRKQTSAHGDTYINSLRKNITAVNSLKYLGEISLKAKVDNSKSQNYLQKRNQKRDSILDNYLKLHPSRNINSILVTSQDINSFKQRQRITHLDLLEKEQYYDSEAEFGEEDALQKEITLSNVLRGAHNIEQLCANSLLNFENEILRLKKRLKKIIHIVNEILY